MNTFEQDALDDLRWELEGPRYIPRCGNGMCGATDCPDCYPSSWNDDAEDDDG